jgi:peptidoglycan hydrolase FlgJ
MTPLIQPPLPLARQDIASKALKVEAPTAMPLSQISAKKDRQELREAFDDFVGQTFYSQMLSAMRKTVDKPAYFHGGHAEEAFQAQLDQTLAETLADATAEQFTGPMFDLFTLPRR